MRHSEGAFLTTDDDLIRRAGRCTNELRTREEPGILVSGGSSMIRLEKMSDEDYEDALAILHREMGLDGLARFLHLYRPGTGDYTRDRHQWLEGATIQDIMAEVERRDKPRSEEHTSE